MLKKSVGELVEVVPIEYHKGYFEEDTRYRIPRWHSPRIIRYRDLSLNPNLTLKDLEMIIAKTRMKQKASVQNNNDRYIVYRYGKKPIMSIDLLERKTCVTKETIEEYGERACQQQASLLMRLLMRYGHAKFNRVTVTANPYRIGRTKEDRNITFKAIHYLFGDYEEKEA